MKNTISFILADKTLNQLFADSFGDEYVLQEGLTQVVAPLVIDVASFTKHTSEILKTISIDDIFVISDKTDEENMELIKNFNLKHIIGRNSHILMIELKTNLQKYFSKKIWGLSQYLEKSAETKIISLSDSMMTNEMVAEALSHFDFKDYFSSPSEYIQVMANELISNSLYKGANSKRVESGKLEVTRKEPVFLRGSELVQINLGMDANFVALSVQDSFGGLKFDTLVNSLKRSFDEKKVMDKQDGAGIGLYLTFLHSNQFIVNLKENYRTEVICIIDKNKRYKSYKERVRSFHFFKEGRA